MARFGARACLINDRRKDQIRRQERLRGELSAEMGVGFCARSLTTNSGYAQQLAATGEAGWPATGCRHRRLEAAHLDRTIGGFSPARRRQELALTLG